MAEHARIYEELFVPADFQRWAPVIIQGARVGRGHRVLDVARGTGVVAREAAQRVLSKYVDADGRLRFRSPAHIVTGTA